MTQAHSKNRQGVPLLKQMVKSASYLSLFTLTGIGLLLAVMQLTHEDIAEAERAKMLSTLQEVLPQSYYDNDPLSDTKQVTNLAALGSSEPVTVYRARLKNQPAGVILQTIAPDGYSGNIYILIGVLANGKVSGVRVIKHKETPGLGDKIELKKSPWITGFDGKQLTPANDTTWHVKKDGGQFDQFTGATITPRAVVKAVRKTLEFVHSTGKALYE